MSNFEYRDTQVRAANKILLNLEEVDNLILNGPTGCGKSGIAYLMHERLLKENPNHKTTIFCNQKLLQDQYADFLDDREGDIMVMKGKSNYLCFADGRTSVEDAPCQHGIRCKDQAFCEYWQRRQRLPHVPLLIINYHMVLSLMDTQAGWSRKTDLCIFDESHSLADIITDYYKIAASNTEVPHYGKIEKALEKLPVKEILMDLDDVMHSLSSLRFDNPIDVMENLFHARMSLSTDLYNLLEQMPPYLQQNKGLLSMVSSQYNKETHFCSKCQHWLRLRDTVRYVPDLQRSDEVVSFSLTPLKVDTVVEPLLKTLSPKRQFMSATIFPRVFMGYVGLKDSFRHLQLPNAIPVENRKVIINPIANFNNLNMKHGEPEFEFLIDNIQALLEFHGSENHSGVIFTPSYKLASMLRKELEPEATKLGYQILINYGSDGRDSVIENFRNTTRKKRLLISPSFSEGINFEDDISRFQIIAKAPFKSLGDAYVKERMKVDKEWFELDCLMKIIQSLGRSCRHANDFCISYIFDGNVLRLYKRYIRDIPQWFKDAVVIEE